MVLATSTLARLVQDNNMSLLRKNIRGASIDLRIDDIAHIRTDTTPLVLSNTDKPDELLFGRLTEVDLAKGFQLEPGQYLYGKAFESITIPNNMCGFVFPRSSFARIGLILPISCYANPGYHGNLPLIIHNASPVPVEIPPYYRVAQLVYCEILGDAIEYDAQLDAKYQNEEHQALASLDDVELESSRKLTEQDIIELLK
ncbi:MAG: dCTP deaminase [Deferribacteraceae bacterium]|jgi:dCTP deaminase|nr:dCTP deaminase [Deferribacteraceae bacterium]